MRLFLGLMTITLCATVPAMAQLGYGAVGSGLLSSLQGISSGYGYGYNNAVGMSGLGANAGTGTYMAPLGYGLVGYGGYGGLGYGGYGRYPAGYYGGAGLNGGIGLNGYGANTAGLATGGAGWGSGSGTAAAIPVQAAAVPVQAAVIPTTGTVAAAPLSAYGRSDDAAIPQTTQLQQGNFAQNPAQTNQGFNSQGAFPTDNSNSGASGVNTNVNGQLQQG